MDTMLKDMKISNDLNVDFNKSNDKKRIPYEIQIQVLTTGNWSNE